MNSTIAPIKAALAALKDTEKRLCDPGIALAPKSDQVAAGIRVELLRRRNIQEAALVAALSRHPWRLFYFFFFGRNLSNSYFFGWGIGVP